MEELCGFRPNRSCADHIFTPSTIIEAQKKQSLSSFVYFVDFKKVFDSISRDFLWKKMELKTFFKIIRAIQMLDIRTVKVNKLLNDYFGVDQGVSKDVLSQTLTLFNISINDL